MNPTGKIVGDWVVVQNKTSGNVDYWWNNGDYENKDNFLVSLKDGTRKLLQKKLLIFLLVGFHLRESTWCILMARVIIAVIWYPVKV